jgi:LPPG:FO 2-phospho-L-lactate transferase
MARALRDVLDPGLLTVVVNVGDDTERYGVHVSADPDTVLYTLAGIEGIHGWGRSGDTTRLMSELPAFGVDTTFTLGDADYALCLARTLAMRDGAPLSEITRGLAGALGIHDVSVLPATDDPVRTWVETTDGMWLDFQHYFVDRRHADPVRTVEYRGAEDAVPAPGVLDAIARADTVVIAPSNPPLSIWPILAIDEIAAAVRSHPSTVAVSPLFGGRALKGPAADVMSALGLPEGTGGILRAYAGFVNTLFVDRDDHADTRLSTTDVEVRATNTRLTGDDLGAECAMAVLGAAS